MCSALCLLGLHLSTRSCPQSQSHLDKWKNEQDCHTALRTGRPLATWIPSYECIFIIQYEAAVRHQRGMTCSRRSRDFLSKLYMWADCVLSDIRKSMASKLKILWRRENNLERQCGVVHQLWWKRFGGQTSPVFISSLERGSKTPIGILRRGTWCVEGRKISGEPDYQDLWGEFERPGKQSLRPRLLASLLQWTDRQRKAGSVRSLSRRSRHL